jgi:hypothetical protein
MNATTPATTRPSTTINRRRLFTRYIYETAAGLQPGGLADGSRWSFGRAGGRTTTGTRVEAPAHPGGMPENCSRMCGSILDNAPVILPSMILFHRF